MRRAVDVNIEMILLTVRRVDRKNPPEFCGVDNCARPHRTLNLCWSHYQRFYKWRKKHDWVLPEYDYFDVSPYVQPFRGLYEISVKDIFCHVPGCFREHEARGLCRPHYLMWWKGVKRNG